MLQEANISVFETLYALGGFYPSAATSGACANQPLTRIHEPITSTLVMTQWLIKTIHHLQRWRTSGGYQGEDWGPGSTWACLSWVDSNGTFLALLRPLHLSKWNPNNEDRDSNQ